MVTGIEVAVLSVALKIAADKLVSLITSEIATIIGVTKDLRELQDKFEDITMYLSDIEAKKSGATPNWLKQLKALLNDFDDLLYRLEAEKHRADIDRENQAMANWFCTKPKSALSRPKIAHEIKAINKRFGKITKHKTEVSTLVSHDVQPTENTNTLREKSVPGYIPEEKMLGRGEIKHKIVAKLVEADTQERISIVSIVGLGGSGKTTLAKYIGQDNKIKEHFKYIYWVFVSEECSVEKLTGKLFELFSDSKSEKYNSRYIRATILENLSGRKFLLVLDDAWNKDKFYWEQFLEYFTCGAPGSKILLTTRDEEIAQTFKSAELAKAFKSAEVINLPFLSDEESWKLFQQSSGWAEKDLDPEFIEVGKEIVRKCAGVPMAIKSLAGTLENNKHITEWCTLRDSSNLLTDMDIQSRVSGSLRLSYFHLPDDVKQCFLLCSVFPKGYYIVKSHLISLWIAHGIVNSMNGGRQLEDIGSDYFNCLLKVCFLQDLEENSYCRDVTCKMHDLVHDLSRQILQDEIVLTPKRSTNDHNQICRYLSLSSCTEKIERKFISKLRTLFISSGFFFATDKPIKEGCCMRSVILEYITDISATLFLSKFEYLGYLRISNSYGHELPEAITDCWNLQALHVIKCHYIAKLPESIGNLRKLRTLELSHNLRLESLPESIGHCDNLEILHLIYCTKLKIIPDSLCKNGKLRLLNISRCASLLHLPSGSFRMLRNLQTINLSGCNILEDLPDSFACDKLHTLKLHGLSILTALPQNITSLSYLEHLDLQYCSGLVELHAGIENLRRLVVLDLKKCSRLVELPEGIVNLKSLVVLNLEGCFGLRGLPAGFRQLTRLQTLGLFVIGDSSEHAKISELGSLDGIGGKLEIRIRHVMDPDDVEKAYLKKKNNIHILSLNMETKMEQEAGIDQDMAVLSVLEPPSGIMDLAITDYKGFYLPHWLTKKRHLSNLNSGFEQTIDLPHFPHMTAMSLSGLRNLKQLTELVELPSLKSLKLHNFDTLERINIGPFPSLIRLSIESMPHSLELTTARRAILHDGDGPTVCSNQKMQCCFPHLTDLFISMCPKLNLNPCFPASLESLDLTNSIVWPVHPHGDKFESPSCGNSNGAIPCSTLIKKLEINEMGGPSCTSGWEFLQHLGVVESLQITCCDEGLKQLPESMRSLTTLQQLKISSCSGLCVLPDWFGEFRSLRKLETDYCGSPRELFEEIRNLTSLQELRIGDCHALHQLPSLRKITIEKLPLLTSLPESLQGLISLEYIKITIRWLPVLTSLPESLRGLISLEYLEIRHCDALHRLPDQLRELRSLRELHLPHLPALTCLPEFMRGLTSLQFLYIEECDALHQLPEALGELPCLRNIRIEWLSVLTSLPESMQGLVSLEYLQISGCDALLRLPDKLGELRSLRELHLSDLPALTSLPDSIGQLCALQTLNIIRCHGLTSLPCSIHRLTALQSLHMWGNPDLARRYKNGVGKDWHLISHIPNVIMVG